MAATENKLIEELGVSLKEYLDTRFAAVEDAILAVEKLHGVMVENIAEATTLAKIAVENRLEKMNGDASELKEKASHSTTRAELNTSVELLESAIERASKGKVSWAVALAITILTSLSLSLVVLVLTFSLK